MLVAARRANVGARLSMARTNRERPLDPVARVNAKLNRLEQLAVAQDDRILVLEAIVHGLAILVDRVDSVSDYAASLGESAERRLSA